MGENHLKFQIIYFFKIVPFAENVVTKSFVVLSVIGFTTLFSVVTMCMSANITDKDHPLRCHLVVCKKFIN